MMATTLLVVPRSIPIGLAMFFSSCKWPPLPAQGGLGGIKSNRCAQCGNRPDAVQIFINQTLMSAKEKGLEVGSECQNRRGYRGGCQSGKGLGRKNGVLKIFIEIATFPC